MNAAALRKDKKQNLASQNIKVFVRLRPLNTFEKNSRSFTSVECHGSNRIQVQDRPIDKVSKEFTFDRVFDGKSRQVDIYKSVAKPLVEEVLNGFNCTIFAYGQTSTGKTYTMEGELFNGSSPMEDNISAGIIPRCVNQLFDELRIQKVEFTMRVSFLELYNEELFDLLSANDDLSKLRMYECAAQKGSCLIQGLEEVLVRSKADVYKVLEKGSAKRQTAATLMNANSSRSHTVFTITVHIKENTEDGDELLKTGKLHLVDLAGSENIGRSGAVDKRAREAGNINISLLTLGRVITSLVEKAPHVPYRESKLTRLLQDALGGRTKTSIIATISPASINLEESLSTLVYANRAKNIKNCPEVNKKVNKKEFIEEYSHEIDRLRRDLLAMREKDGVYLATDDYSEMMAMMEQQAKEICDKIEQIRAIEAEKDKQKEHLNSLTLELQDTTDKLTETKSKLTVTKDTLSCTQKLLSDTAQDRDEQSCLVSAHVKTEEKLHTQGYNLIDVADTTTDDIQKLHDKIDRKKKVEVSNEEIGSEFSKEFKGLISSMRTNLSNVTSKRRDSLRKMSDKMCTLTESQTELCNASSLLETISTTSFRAFEELGAMFNTQMTSSCEDINTFARDRLLTCGDLSTYQLSIKDEFSRTLTKMSALVAQIGSTNAKCQGVIEKIIEAEKLNNKEREFDTDFLNNFENQLLELSVCHKREMAQRITKFNDNRKRRILELYDEDSAELKNLISSLDEKMIQRTESITKEMVSSGISKLTNDSELNRGAAAICNDAHTALASISDEVDGEVSDLGAERCSLETAIDHHHNHTVDVNRDITKSIKDIQESQNFKFVSATSMISNLVEEDSSLVSSMIDDQIAKIEKEINRIKDFVQLFDKELSHESKSLSNFNCDHDSSLVDVNERVQSLFMEKIAKDIATGHTPIRRDYPYPRILADTSPHARILQRYRSAVNGGSKIPLPIDSMDNDVRLPIEDTSSFSSCDHSQLSNASSAVGDEGEVDDEKSPAETTVKGGSFKYPGTILVPPQRLQRQKSREEVRSAPASRSSSASSISEMKENASNDQLKRTASLKKQLRPPTDVNKYVMERPHRARKVLGSFN